jgi:hypothetical protein
LLALLASIVYVALTAARTRAAAVLFSGFAPFQARLDETTKQRMRLRRLGAELRMALHGHESRVIKSSLISTSLPFCVEPEKALPHDLTIFSPF